MQELKEVCQELGIQISTKQLEGLLNEYVYTGADPEFFCEGGQRGGAYNIML